MQPASIWHLPVRKIVFARTDNPAKTFTVTLHSDSDRDATKRAREILRMCHAGSAKHFGQPVVSLVTEDRTGVVTQTICKRAATSRAQEPCHA